MKPMNCHIVAAPTPAAPPLSPLSSSLDSSMKANSAGRRCSPGRGGGEGFEPCSAPAAPPSNRIRLRTSRTVRARRSLASASAWHELPERVGEHLVGPPRRSISSAAWAFAWRRAISAACRATRTCRQCTNSRTPATTARAESTTTMATAVAESGSGRPERVGLQSGAVPLLPMPSARPWPPPPRSRPGCRVLKNQTPA